MLLLAILIPLLLIQTLIYYDRFKSKKNEEIRANTEIARAVGNTFEAFIYEILNHELIIGLSATATPPLAAQELTRILIRSTETNPVISSFSWVSPHGLILSSSHTEWVGSQLADRPYFQDILTGREWVVSDLLLSWANQGPLFTIVRGIRDKKGRLLGIVLAAIAPENLGHVLALKRSKGADICIFDRNGMLVYRQPEIGLTWEERNWLDSDPLLRKARDGNVVAETTQSSHNRESRVMAYVPISPIGWAVSAGRSQEEVLEPIYSTLVKHGGLFLSVAIIAFIVALAISRDISRPIRKLQKHALALGYRDKQEQIELSGLKELEDLAHAFNFMSGQVLMWVGQAEQRAKEAEEGKRVLDALMEHVPEGIAIVSGPPVVIQKISTHGLGLLGCPRGKIDNQAFVYNNQQWTLWHTDGTTPAGPDELPFIRTIRSGRPIYNEEWILQKANGDRITILCDAGPIRNKNDAIIGAIVAWRDISERKKAEQDLQKARDELEYKVRERTFELEQRNREFNELAATTIEAMENDRKSLAQEVHDSIGGTLAAIMYQLEERISHMGQSGPACGEMSFERILAHLMGAIHQTRRISKRLRPSVLDDFGLVAALKETIADFREFFPKLDIQQEIDIAENAIPSEINIVLYRVIQEALNNIGKHSSANHVMIRLSEGNKQVHLQIDDDGCGFDTHARTANKSTLFGYGLTSMKERVELCRGEFYIHSEIGKGTSIRVSLPLNAHRNGHWEGA